MPRWTSNVGVTADGPINQCYGHVASDAIAQSIADTFFSEAAGFIPGPDAGSFDSTVHGRTLLGLMVFDFTKIVLVLEGPSTSLNIPVTLVVTKDIHTATLDVADAQVQVINSNVYIYWDSLPGVVGAELNGTFQLTLTGVSITAPVAIEAGANAKVIMTGGSVTASTNSVVASGSAKVDLVGTKVSGKSKASAAAKITGAP